MKLGLVLVISSSIYLFLVWGVAILLFIEGYTCTNNCVSSLSYDTGISAPFLIWGIVRVRKHLKARG